MRTLSKIEIENLVMDYPHYCELQPHEIKARLNRFNNESQQDIQKIYIDEVYEPLTDAEMKRLLPAIEKANVRLYKVMKMFGLEKKVIPWKFVKTKNGFDWDLCHTKADVIILPQRKLNDNKDMARTLTHEMIHLYQRYYPMVFKRYYEQKMHFSDLNLNEKQEESLNKLGIDRIFVTNPDTCEMGLMVYKNRFIPITIIMPNGRTPVNLILTIMEDKVVLQNKKPIKMNSYDGITLDQPNEMFAYIFSK